MHKITHDRWWSRTRRAISSNWSDLGWLGIVINGIHTPAGCFYHKQVRHLRAVAAMQSLLYFIYIDYWLSITLNMQVDILGFCKKKLVDICGDGNWTPDHKLEAWWPSGLHDSLPCKRLQIQTSATTSCLMPILSQPGGTCEHIRYASAKHWSPWKNNVVSL